MSQNNVSVVTCNLLWL
uniref:Uncharacterized protein n=1 Tax=Anguilla anguilla TaxID=7936 RepID=A0A0E9UYB9_ANGAN